MDAAAQHGLLPIAAKPRKLQIRLKCLKNVGRVFFVEGESTVEFHAMRADSRYAP